MREIRAMWLCVAGLILEFFGNSAPAAIRYVDGGNLGAQAPYTNWSQAARTIQDAINVAMPGEMILVTNGIYSTGYASLTNNARNRVVLTNQVVVLSVNGPEATTIRGLGPNGPAAIRCAYVGNGSLLAGFTLTEGHTRAMGNWEADLFGGGTWCEDGGVVSNCVIAGNSAFRAAGGARGGSYYACIISNNQSDAAGGVYWAKLENCSILNNTASSKGGGLYSCYATNCLVAGNVAGSLGGGTYYGVFSRCMFRENSAASGGAGVAGNYRHCAFIRNQAEVGGGLYREPFSRANAGDCTFIDNYAKFAGAGYEASFTRCVLFRNHAQVLGAEGDDCNYYDCFVPYATIPSVNRNPRMPLIAGLDNPHLLLASPCIDYLTNTPFSAEVDMDGESWPFGAGPDIGCDEVLASGLVGGLTLVVTAWSNFAAGYSAPFECTVYGKPQGFVWTWGDGLMTTNLCVTEHAYAEPGIYEVVLTAWNMDETVATTTRVAVSTAFTNYVDLAGGHMAPFSSWASAATNLQAAVDAVPYPGGIVMVAPGVYESGMNKNGGKCPCRVVVTNKAILRGLDRGTCIIRGVPTVGAGAVRGAWLGDGARIENMTIQEGGTLGEKESSDFADTTGGGIFAEAGGVASNVVVRSCQAYNYGGGLMNVALWTGRVESNRVTSAGGTGGGMHGGVARSSFFSRNEADWGGGLSYGAAWDCSFHENQAHYGGGMSRSYAWQCLLSRNHAYSTGGGAVYGTLQNSVIIGNQAVYDGGISYANAYSSIIYYNKATISGNNYYQLVDYTTNVMDHCCTTPLPVGDGNITNEPAVLGFFNAHIAFQSACRDAGAATPWDIPALDMDGEPRQQGPRLDMGCDEYYEAGVTGPVSVAIRAAAGRCVRGYPLQFEAVIEGRASEFIWNFGDGTVRTNEFQGAHVFSTTGLFAVCLSAYYINGCVADTVTVEVVESYVNYASPGGNHVWPFLSWTDAATNIQAAVDANQTAGGEVRLSPGLYNSGGNTALGYHLTNRVILGNAMRLVGSGDPASIIIQGAGPVGDAAVRCLLLGDGAEVHGITLRGGATRDAGDWLHEQTGAGVIGAQNSMVSNCIIQSCESCRYGGGASMVQLKNCRIEGNVSSNGGGAYYCELSGCLILTNRAVQRGGGDYNCVVTQSMAVRNYAREYGGGSYNSLVFASELRGNRADNFGGGGAYGEFAGCIFVTNTAGSWGGGAMGALVSNCVFNANTSGNRGGGMFYGRAVYCSMFGNTSIMGGALSDASAEFCEFESNSAMYAGAVIGSTCDACTFQNNRASQLGGGAMFGTNRSCWFQGNLGTYGGGAGEDTVMDNCTIISNYAYDIGAGVRQSICQNSIIRYNYCMGSENNYDESSCNHCFTWPLPVAGINYESSPGIIGWANPRLLSNSPCVNAGVYLDWMTNAMAWDGGPRVLDGQVDIGCAEYNWATRTGTISACVVAHPAKVTVNYPARLFADITGQISGLAWTMAGETNQLDYLFLKSWNVKGDYDVVLQLWNADGAFAVTVRVQVADAMITYVAPNGGNQAPYTNWAKAARSIQDAISVNDVAGGLVLVSNGIYDTASVAVTNGMLNRIAITNPITVRSVNGPAVTIIKGRGPRGPTAIRCAWLGRGASLEGFTLTNGFTHLLGDIETELRGGGAWCDTSAMISNCIIAGCSACSRGGGVHQGFIVNSTLRDNTVLYYGGGASYADLSDCLIEGNRSDLGAGAVMEGIARNCVVRDNSAGGDAGGGGYDAVLENCLLVGNRTLTVGGGQYYGVLKHCTVVSNTAHQGGGGAYLSTIYSSIICSNLADAGAANIEPGFFGESFYTCSFPLPDGEGNIDEAPGFVDWLAGDYRLLPDSPCIDAATNLAFRDDLAHMCRPLDGNNDGVAAPDMGVYEYLCEEADSDADLMADGGEVAAGTDPTDAASYLGLRQAERETTYPVLAWPSASGREYQVEYSDLATGVWMIPPAAPAVPATPPINVYTSSVPIGATPWMYRVRLTTP